METLWKPQARWSFMGTARSALLLLLLRLSAISFGQKKGFMTVVFDVTATPDSTISSLGIQISTDDPRENKIRGKREAHSSSGPEDWRSVKMKLARSAFEGRAVTIEAYTDPALCMSSYRDSGVVLVDGQHYAIDLVRNVAKWQARKTRASMMFAFPRQMASIDTALARMMLRRVDVEVLEMDTETVLADSALVSFDISADCKVQTRSVSVPFTQLRSSLTDQYLEKLQDDLTRWNTGCIPTKDVQVWIKWRTE